MGVRRLLHHVIGKTQDQQGPAKRHRGVAREEPSGLGAEGQRAEPLHPAQVELAPAVDAVQRSRQPAVGLQQLVALEEGPGIGGVGQLEVVARQSVAQIAHGQEAPLDNPVQQLLDQFLPGDFLRPVLGH